jgi:hypothetical protein
MSIEKKLDQLYAALSEMRINDLSSIGLKYEAIGKTTKISLDFSGGTNQATVANRVSLLLHNIACLKDHLSSWCKNNGKQFNGEKFLKTNREAAILHDLWNLDKHGGPSRDSKSGLSPRLLQDAQIVLQLTSGGGRLSPRFEIAIPTDRPAESGRVQTEGEVSLCISALVVDKNGNPLGELGEICQKALAAWEAEFVRAGVTIV